MVRVRVVLGAFYYGSGSDYKYGLKIYLSRDSESILNGTFNAKLNRLYQCQSKISFITILGHCFTTHPGRAQLYDIYR